VRLVSFSVLLLLLLLLRLSHVSSLVE